MATFDLKKFRKDNRISQQMLADYLGVGQGFVSQMERGDRPMPSNIRERILGNTEWVLCDDSPMDSIDDHPGRMIPLIPSEAMAGPGVFDYGQLPTEDWYVVNEFKHSDFLIRIKGDSMAPKFSGGDLVACKIVKETLFFQWGRIYVLCTKSQGIMIKRLQPSKREGYITCISENEKYPPFDVPTEDLVAVALVNGSITLE